MVISKNADIWGTLSLRFPTYAKYILAISPATHMMKEGRRRTSWRLELKRKWRSLDVITAELPRANAKEKNMFRY